MENNDTSEIIISEKYNEKSSNVAVDENPQQKLSKNALKKLRRQQKWEETREARKAALKEKDKRKKEEKRKAKELGLYQFINVLIDRICY
jgi:hypothetical protein